MKKKKKICFVSLSNIYLCPYIYKYIQQLDCDYDVIYWDRHGVEESIDANQIFPFRYKMNEGNGKLSKLIGYFKFQKFAKKTIKKNNYDGIILLQTSIGIMMSLFLKSRYLNKYILDIRDYTLENNFLFFNLEKALINRSAYTVISSKGYHSFLPEYEYIVVHNDANIDKENREKFEMRKRSKSKIVISYIGLIRFHDQNKKNILKFRNDNRFILKFIGKDAYALKDFCIANNVNNVELVDWFPPDKTLEYYLETDIIYNLYGQGSPQLDFALSNKLYYAAILKIPILVFSNTHMEKTINEYNFGFVFNINDPQACDDLFNYYHSIDWSLFTYNCNNFIEEVNKDNLVFNNMLRKFINQI